MPKHKKFLPVLALAYIVTLALYATIFFLIISGRNEAPLSAALGEATAISVLPGLFFLALPLWAHEHYSNLKWSDRFGK